MIVQVGESGNQDFSSPCNYVEARWWVSILILSSCSWQLGHHRIVAYGEQKYSFVPHSHAILALLCLWTFVPFHMSPPTCLSYWILIQDPLSHSALLCEWCTSSFSSRTERIFQQSSTYDLAFCFNVWCFQRSFFTLIFLLAFVSWHGII